MPKKLAKQQAQAYGINMDVECAWVGPPDQDGFTPFGPDPRKDNIYQNIHPFWTTLLKYGSS